MLGEIKQYEYVFFTNFTATHCPYFEERDSFRQMQDEIVETLAQLNKQYFTNILESPLLYSLPDGGNHFALKNISNTLEMTLTDLKFS